jgi:hypothetical protein
VARLRTVEKAGKSAGKASATNTMLHVSAKRKGDLDAVWQTYGLTNATVTAMPITVPVLLLFDAESPESFFIAKPLLYGTTAGKSGRAK